MWPPDSSGSWADWVSGIATALTLIYLVWQTMREKKNAKGLHSRRFAELVSAWVVPSESTSMKVRRDAFTEHTIDVPIDYVYVDNASQTAIYDLIAFVFPASKEPTTAELRSTFRDFVHVVPPGRHKFETSWNHHEGSYTPSATLIFRDAQGIFWMRTNRGDLRKATSKDLALLSILQSKGAAELLDS